MRPDFGKNSGMHGLVRRMKKGDRNAAAALYDELAGKVFGFCMNRVWNRAAAEDLTQDIFLKLIDKADTFDETRGSFSVWFWRMARNAVIDYHREKKETLFAEMGDEEVGEIVSETGTGEASLAAKLDAKTAVERLRKFADGLKEDEKELFELRYLSELSYKEIAEILGKSEGALRVMTTRLKKKLKAV